MVSAIFLRQDLRSALAVIQLSELLVISGSNSYLCVITDSDRD